MKRKVGLLGMFLLMGWLCLLTDLNAQSLTFNQVLMPTISGNISSITNITQTVTVPVGKVWKIESASLVMLEANGAVRANSTNAVVLTVDDHLLTNSYSSGGANPPYNAEFPVWLPEGTHTLKISNYNQYVFTSTAKGSLSVIEFNVVP